MLTYLLINLVTLLVPVLFSFDKNLRFVRYWRYLFPAILISGVIFVAWDVFFTALDVWSFNKLYVMGPQLMGLPIEELLFFITVPFACVFIYEVLQFYIQRDYLGVAARWIGIAAIMLMIWLVFTYPEKLYTSVSALLACTLLTWHHLFFYKPWLGRFWLAYVVCIIPFLIVNGILTSLPVVIYNNEYNLGMRLFTIPVEDLIYQFNLMMFVIALYEKQRGYRRVKQATTEV